MSTEEGPRVINRYHYRSPEHPKLPALPDGAILVMRGTPLGNPYERAYLERWAKSTAEIAAKVRADPEYLLEPFKRHLFRQIEAGDEGVIRAFSQISTGSSLICCCVRPDGSGVCHAKIVARAWRWWWDAGCTGLRVGIVGSKTWPAVAGGQYVEINHLMLKLPSKALVMARHVDGIDTYAIQEAKHFELGAEVIEIDREKDGKGAEFKRDRRLVERAHWVYAFLRGKSTGTQHIIDLCDEIGRPCDVARMA